ncbi:hypothetical protein [Rhodococcus qingshengii]|uniref:hypothetical protein n=1 Tax=Rhodococcus qingshengii TaxID=334542 RepID=UPI00242B5674|nr:hypothetical protein [Rhodococcus erythropolis]
MSVPIESTPMPMARDAAGKNAASATHPIPPSAGTTRVRAAGAGRGGGNVYTDALAIR